MDESNDRDDSREPGGDLPTIPPQPPPGGGMPSGSPETVSSQPPPRQPWDVTPTPGAELPVGRGPVPFQEMRLGQLLDAAIKLYRARWGMFIGITSAIMVPYLAIQALAQAAYFPEFDPFAEPTGESFAGPIIVGLLSLGLYVFITPFLTGAIARATSEIYLGRAPSVGDILSFTLSIFGSLLLVSLLVFLVVFGGFLLLIVPGIIFAIRFYLSTNVLVIEGLKGRDALKRSWRVTKGYASRVFGILFVSGILAAIVGGIIELPLSAIALATGGGTGIFLSFIGTAIGTVVTTPFTVIVTVLLYYDLRIRKEGYDLTLLAQELGQPPLGS